MGAGGNLRLGSLLRATHDLATLDHWVRRAALVACAGELFDG